MHTFKVTLQSLIANKCQVTVWALPLLLQTVLRIACKFFGFLKTQIMLLDKMIGIDSSLGENSVTETALLIHLISHYSPAPLCFWLLFAFFPFFQCGFHILDVFDNLQKVPLPVSLEKLHMSFLNVSVE